MVGWQAYYRDSLEPAAGNPLIDHRGPYLGGDTRHAELIDAIAGGRSAFLIAAPAGCGKSRFALELARRLERLQRSWEVRFVRRDETALAGELQELQKASRLILIVDDAHDCPALVQRLTSACFGRGPSPTHLICLTRPAGRAPLLEALASHYPLSEPLEMDLGRPGPKVIRALVDAQIPQLSPHHRDVIRRFVADSFFSAVLLCSSVARQKKLPQTLSTKNLRDYAVRQPLAQAVGDLCPLEKAFRALAVYAACAPVDAGDAEARSSAATHAALPLPDVAVLEQRVLEAGLFETDERGRICPVPALGDLILEEACLDEQGRPTSFGRALVRALLEQRRYDPVISNCGDVGRLFSSPERVNFLSELLLEMAAELRPENRTEAAEMLVGCAGLAVQQPRVVVRLIEALGANGVLLALPAALEPGRALHPEVHAQGLLIAAGECDPTIVPRALDYARQLLESVRADDDTYRALLDSLGEFCQFAVERPLGHATAVLAVLKGWSEDSNAQTAELAASLVRGFLSLEILVRCRGPDAPPPVSIGLDPADEIWKVRDQAIGILVRCANHASPSVGYAAAGSVRHWAHGYGRLTAEALQRWEPQLDRELDLLAVTFGRVGSATAHLPVRAAVERLGWQWWMDGAAPFIRRGGSRILAALPEAASYSLWKGLHAAGLPIFPLSPDESVATERRREHLLPVMEPSATRAVDLARELFDRLDVLCHDASAWSTLLVSAVSELPRQALHARARVYLKEFVARHPDDAWSLVTEEVADGPLSVLLPTLLSELRGQDTQRWHQAIQRALAGTRLFEMELGALCSAGELDPMERAMVSKGLELDDARIVHLSAQALLGAEHTALGSGLAAVFASLPRRATDERLWELTLDAFVRWADHLLTSPAGEEPNPETRAASGELLRLLRTSGSSLRWDQGPHTRRLAEVLAIFAAAVPHTLKSWMRQEGMPAADGAPSDLVLSPGRVLEAVRLLSKSSVASFWQKQFVEWMTEEPDLAMIGARGLAQLCGLGDPCVGPLMKRVAQQPTDFSLPALSEFVDSSASSPRFVEDAISLCRHLADAPEAYALLEKEIIATMVRAGRAGPAAVGGRNAVLEALDRAMRGADLPEPLRQTFARARQALQGTVEDYLLRGEAH